MKLGLWCRGILVYDLPTTGLTGSSFTWTPSTSLSDGKYLLQLSAADGSSFYDRAYTALDHNSTDAIVSNSSQVSSSYSAAISSTSELKSPLAPVTATGTSWRNPVSASGTPEPLDMQQNRSPQHPISHGAIAGIVIGAITIIILISASAILYWRRRRRRSSQQPIPELPNNQTDTEIKTDPYATIWVPELDQEGAVYGPHELPDTPTPQEEPLEATRTSSAEGSVVEIGDPE